MDAARELAQLLERQCELGARAVEDLRGVARIRRELRLREAQRQRQRDESLLRAVVEVALQPASLSGLGPDDAGA